MVPLLSGGGVGVGVYSIMVPLVIGGGEGVGVYSIMVPLVVMIVEVAQSGEPVGHSCLTTKRPRTLSDESLLSDPSFNGCKIARG